MEDHTAIDLTTPPAVGDTTTQYPFDEFSSAEESNGMEDDDSVLSADDNSSAAADKMPLASDTTSLTDELSEEDPATPPTHMNTIDLTTPTSNSRDPIDISADTDEEGADESSCFDGLEDMDVEEDEDCSEDERKMPAEATYYSDSEESEEDERKISAGAALVLSDSEDEEDDVVLCWPCPQCTLVNSTDRTICEACNAPRSPSRTSSRTHPFVPPPFASRVPTAATFHTFARFPSTPSPFTPFNSVSSTSMPFPLAQFISSQRINSPEAFGDFHEAISRMGSSRRRLTPAAGGFVSEQTMRMMQAMSARSPDHSNNNTYEQLLQAFGNGTENMGASDSAIQQLPVSTVGNPSEDLPENHITCNICLEDFVSGDERRTLPCLHGYHKGCADKWLKTNGTCPVCKHPIGK